jgi:hypothetical protein
MFCGAKGNGFKSHDFFLLDPPNKNENSINNSTSLSFEIEMDFEDSTG